MLLIAPQKKKTIMEKIIDVIGDWTPLVLLCLPLLLAITALVLSLFKNRYRHNAICLLWWLAFPLLFPLYAKRYGVIKKGWKRWLIVLFSPFWSFCFFMVILAVFCMEMDQCDYYVPAGTDYHTAHDIEVATGVEFPEVIPVDSSALNSWSNNYTRVRFIPKKPLTRQFFKQLDRACKEDSCCWRKDSLGYVYLIYPERPLDRTKGTHTRRVEVRGEMIPDWDGDYVRVIVPIVGDTITVEDGWYR